MNPRLGNGDPALFHDFVDGRPIHVGHFVELVNADNATVCQDHCAGLETSLAGLLVGGDSGSETHAGRASPGRRHGPGRGRQDVAQHLGLGHGGIADQQDVDVATKAGTVGQMFFQAACIKEELMLIALSGK